MKIGKNANIIFIDAFITSVGDIDIIKFGALSGVVESWFKFMADKLTDNNNSSGSSSKKTTELKSMKNSSIYVF